MGIIRVLPDRVANQIAAGEVVERPASVVKELLENALDAGAGRIRIEAEGGGRKRIRVVDDGQGMTRDDALLAFERHATSKLATAEDLAAVATLGFRGEALPAIAAASRLTLETRARGAEAGTRVEIAGGKLGRVTETGAPEGTAISVENLFFNLPARRKFLKSETTELGHIATLATHYALAYPEIRFELETPGRAIFRLPPAESSGERLRQLFGQEWMASLVEFSHAAAIPASGREGMDQEAETAGREEAAAEPGAALTIYGYVSKPEVQKVNRNSIFTFVNRRLVRDRLLQHALAEAYRNLLPHHLYPAAVLFLEMPFAEVDVNVHPAKVEVRFQRASWVHDATRDAIREALGAARPVPSLARQLAARPSAGAAWSALDWEGGAAALAAAAPAAAGAGESAGAGGRHDGEWRRGAEAAPGFRLTREIPPPRARALEFPAPEAAAPRADSALGRAAARGSGCEARGLGGEDWLPGAPPAGEAAAGGGEAAAWGGASATELETLEPMGQVRESFILAAGANGVWLIDQHAAHERVLFEQFMEAMRREETASQPLLLPAVVQLDPGRWLMFGEAAPILRRAGFEVEPFGRNTLAVKATPALFPASAVEPLLEELLTPEGGPGGRARLEGRMNRVVATVACHAAIKINTRLEPAKMRWLLRELAGTRFPMTCPHGRPVMLHYSLREIQAAFRRIR